MEERVVMHSTPEKHREIEAHAALALQAILAGREPSPGDLDPVTGDLRACLFALLDALHADGPQGARKAFLALAKDRPYLMQMAVTDPPVFNPDGTLAPPAAESEPPARRIRFVSSLDILQRPSQQWLLPALLPRDALVLVYGLSGGFKSFLVMAWALAIGTGTPWLGRVPTRAPVAYIAAEGGYGLKKRLRAWMTWHDWQDAGELGVKWYDQPLAMQEPAHLAELLTALREDFEQPPALVVVDTLSRCAAGADEDSNTDMARVLAAADIIREQFHCTILLVHHVGKDQQKGPRGASALLCNVEAAISVTPTAVGSKVECAKTKDARPFERMYLHAQEVRYGPEEDDCSLVLIRGDASAEADRPLMGRDEQAMYDLLLDKALTYTEWIKAATAPERGEARLTETAAKIALSALKKAGRVQQSEPRGPYTIVPLPAGDPTGE